MQFFCPINRHVYWLNDFQCQGPVVIFSVFLPLGPLKPQRIPPQVAAPAAAEPRTRSMPQR